MERIDSSRCFGGEQLRFCHPSAVLDCSMHLSVYLPPQARHGRVPVVFWLSGLTCTDQNFVTKAGAQRYAAQHGLALVAPDTSPRGEGVPDDPEGSYDFGLGAGFYLNAKQAPWSAHYRMYDYIVEELPGLLAPSLPLELGRAAICGHSMGGHGALIIALKNPERFRSVSAFAPICAPSACPWGQKAFRGYLGEDPEQWGEWDTTSLLSQVSARPPALVDQGTADDFLAEQLLTPRLTEACEAHDWPLQLRMQEGYDHSYFFIASFIGEHLAFHAGHLHG
jgi:S-formylglutathione hydrolase